MSPFLLAATTIAVNRPTIPEWQTIVGVLLSIGVIVATVGVLVGAAMLVMAPRCCPSPMSTAPRKVLLTSFTAALLIIGADVLVNFFVTAGHSL